jgi:hypothetical protein
MHAGNERDHATNKNWGESGTGSGVVTRNRRISGTEEEDGGEKGGKAVAV